MTDRKINHRDERFSAKNYNTKRFKPENYNFLRFPGPRAGEKAVDFSVHDIDGKPVNLSDFLGRWIVLETGSVTCPMYSNNVANQNKLIEDYPEVEFLLLYVREAHPGERLPQHRSIDEKFAAARMLEPRFNEKRKILVDSIDGDAHRKYASNMPNIVYVINPDGIVTYRCDWVMTDAVRRALDNPDQIFEQEHADTADLAHPPMWPSLKTMFIGGWVALWDFFKALSVLRKEHEVVDDYYKQRGRLDP